MSKKKNPEGPFKGLDALVKEAGLRLGTQETSPAEETAKIESPLPEPNDELLFEREMEGVERSVWDHHPIESPARERMPLRDSAAEELRLMKAAVAGDPALNVLDHPEYIEGWVGVAGKRFLPNLRNGMYSIQGQIDLHGLGREEARQAVGDFIDRMSRFRSCCVKIVHGRGINSPNDRAILKENLQRWLSTRRLSRQVVAYASAPLRDGGVGAIYVLLRSRKTA